MSKINLNELEPMTLSLNFLRNEKWQRQLLISHFY